MSGSGPGEWRDLQSPSPADLEQLRADFGVDPSRLPEGGRAPRPGILHEDGYTVVTLVGAVDSDADDGLGEVRCVIGPGWMVTLHDHVCAPLTEAYRARPGAGGPLDAVAGALVTSLVELVRELDAEIAEIEGGRAADLTPVRRRIAAIRRAVLPQRDVLIRLGQGEGLDGSSEAAARGLRNAAERMAQVSGEVEVLREALHDALTDRQNDVVRRLTIVAVIFLPLTFLTGFFGQNFPWLVDNVGGAGHFVVLGLLLPVAAVAGLLVALRRGGWL